MRAWRVVTSFVVGALLAVMVASHGSPVSASSAQDPFTLVPDPTFAGGVVAVAGWTSVADLAPTADGGVLALLDRVDTLTGALLDQGVAHLRHDGTLDQSFGTAGVVDLGQIAGDTLTMRADGSFLIDKRQYRPDGSVDVGFGVNGYIAAGQGDSTLGNALATSFTTPDGHLFVVTEEPDELGGCATLPVDAGGLVDFTPISAGFGCDAAKAMPMPDGTTVLVLSSPTGAIAFTHFNADGTLDTRLGDGTGTVDAPDDVTGTLVDAAVTTTGVYDVLTGGSIESSTLFELRADPATGEVTELNTGWFDGQAAGVETSDDGGAWVQVGYTYALGSMPYHPALVRVRPDTYDGDVLFNPDGIRPGWLGLTEAGITTPLLAGPMLDDGDRLLLGAGTYPATSGAPRLAIVVALRPQQATLPSPPAPPAPPTPSLAQIGAGATAVQPATRLRLQPTLPRPPT